MDFKNLLKLLDLTKFPCQFVDVRIERTQSSALVFKNDELIETSIRPVIGAFIRVNHHGMWFYSSTTAINEIENEILKLIDQAKMVPKSSLVFKIPANNGVHHLINKTQNDFSQIKLEEKLELVKSYLPVFKKIENLVMSDLAYTDIYKEKFYISSVGTEFSYDFNQAGLFLNLTLKDGENLFEDVYKKYASSFNDLKNLQSEFIDYFTESQIFLTAPKVIPGKYKTVLSPEITGIFTHESFGHKSEADFMMGDPEAAKAWKLGATVGSKCLSIIDSGTHDNTSGWCPIDDEGSLAKVNYLIKEGVLLGRLHSNHTADTLEETATGNARAMNFEYEPIVRMTSTYIKGGTTPFSELLKKAEGGIYCNSVRHGSGGSTFTIAPIRAYLIKEGKLDTPVIVSVISGSVFETLDKVEDCGDDFLLGSSAFGGCGKMEQNPLPVAYGGPSILVSEMQIS